MNRSSVLQALAGLSLSVVQTATQAALLPGDIVISEFMANPSGISDTRGEWLELYNTLTIPLDLRGLRLTDDASNLHVINATAPLIIPAEGLMLLARSNNIDGTGSSHVDYVYRGFTLNNSSDQIVLSDEGGTEIFRVDYTPSLVVAGRSTRISADLTSYMVTDSRTSYDGGVNFGTPGFAPPGVVGVTPVPVPTSITLMAPAIALLASCRKRTRKAVIDPEG